MSALDPCSGGVRHLTCWSGSVYLVGMALSCAIMLQVGRGGGVTVDVYSTSLHVLQFRDGSPSNSSVLWGSVRDTRKDAWRDVVYGPRPVDVDFVHNLGLFWPVVASVLSVLSFLFMSFKMDAETEDCVLDGPYMTENAAVSGSPAATLWTSFFVAGVGASHAVFVPLVVCPAPVERVALVWLLLFLPLAAMCQPGSHPRKAAGYSYNMGSGYDNDDGLRRVIPACGVHTSIGSVVLFLAAVCAVAPRIEYDPDSYRAELLAVVTGLDMLVLGLGHLWDQPSSIGTIRNARAVYCCLVLAVIAVVYSRTESPGGFSVEFVEP